MTKWTQFMDMHSGGGSKEKWENIFIEAPEEEAKIISEFKTLAEATAYARNCEYSDRGYVEKQCQRNMEIRERRDTPDSNPWGLYIPLAKYKKQRDVLVIPRKTIKASERKGVLPQGGYVWQG